MSHWQKRGEGYGTREWQALRMKILERDGFICQCTECKRLKRVRLAMEVDHIVPKSKGGTDAESNLQAINSTCHRLKTIRDRGHAPKERTPTGVDGWPTKEKP